MISEIISGLWIGDHEDTYDEDFINDNLITITINCTIDRGFLNRDDISKIRIPLSPQLNPQTDIEMLKKNIDKILKYIHENIEENNILIYCYNGKTISPLIVGLYILKYGNVSKDLIRDILRSKNENICLDVDLGIFKKKNVVNIIKCLEEIEHRVEPLAEPLLTLLKCHAAADPDADQPADRPAELWMKMKL